MKLALALILALSAAMPAHARDILTKDGYLIKVSPIENEGVRLQLCKSATLCHETPIGEYSKDVLGVAFNSLLNSIDDSRQTYNQIVTKHIILFATAGAGIGTMPLGIGFVPGIAVGAFAGVVFGTLDAFTQPEVNEKANSLKAGLSEKWMIYSESNVQELMAELNKHLPINPVHLYPTY